MSKVDDWSRYGIWYRVLVTKLATCELNEKRRAGVWGMFF